MRRVVILAPSTLGEIQSFKNWDGTPRYSKDDLLDFESKFLFNSSPDEEYLVVRDMSEVPDSDDPTQETIIVYCYVKDDVTIDIDLGVDDSVTHELFEKIAQVIDFHSYSFRTKTIKDYPHYQGNVICHISLGVSKKLFLYDQNILHSDFYKVHYRILHIIKTIAQYENNK